MLKSRFHSPEALAVKAFVAEAIAFIVALYLIANGVIR